MIWRDLSHFLFLFVSLCSLRYGESKAPSLEESVSYCEHLAECESTSKLQERLCMGNWMMMPYWLLPLNPKYEKCHTLLKNDYVMLERLERELDSQMLACYIEQTIPLTERQSESCDSSLVASTREMRDTTGGLIVDNCFMGTAKRIDRQCGGLKTCCTAYKTCSETIGRSYLVDKKTKHMGIIREKAKKCEQGLPVQPLELSDPTVTNRVKALTTNNETSSALSSSSNTLSDVSHPSNNSYIPLSDAITGMKADGDEKTKSDLGLSINYSGSAKKAKEDSEVDAALNSLIAASAASSKAEEDQTGQNTSNESEEGSNENQKDKQDGTNTDIGDSGLITQKVSPSPHRPEIVKKEDCVDADRLKRALDKWYKKLVTEVEVQLLDAPVPTRVNIKDILEKYHPKYSSFSNVDHTDSAEVEDTTMNSVETPKDEKPVSVIEVWKDGGEGTFNGVTSTEKQDEGTKWENEEYKKEIEMFRRRKNNNSLFLQMEERNYTSCDLYIRCRHQVVRGLDTCGVLSGRGELESPFALSTESLLEIGDYCGGQGLDALSRLYELVIRRNKRLKQCLNESAIDDDVQCDSDPKIKNRDISERLSQGNYTTARDCYADANTLQFHCAQLRPCCPYFYKCREQTSDVATEGEILALTSQLTVNNMHCMHRTDKDGNRSNDINSMVNIDDSARKMAILRSNDASRTLLRHSYPPDSRK